MKISRRKEEIISAYIFLSPSLIITFIFVLGPAIAAAYLSFTKYNIIKPPRWIGLSNYFSLIENDSYITSLINTAHYAIIYVPGKIIIGLFLAVLLQSAFLRGRGMFLTIFYIPVITSMPAAAYIWLFLYRPGDGILNKLLNSLGFSSASFIYDTDTVIESITAVTIWKDFGLTVVLFTAGLQAIDKQLYQAAQIDGANSWEQFYNITLPLLQPVFLLVLITTIIDSFNVFTAILIMTAGGPAEGSTTIVHQIYSNAFIYLKMGRAAAMSMTLLILVTFLSIPAFYQLKKQI